MKQLSPLSFFFNGCLFVVLFLTSCSTELATPTPIGIEENRVTARTDFSGLEEQVKVKVAERDNISVSAILTCYYYGETSEGYGRYHLTTNVGFKMYTVTGIIGDDIEGW